ncbi:CSG1/SUR1-like protein [Umbelopsis nana]
MQYVNMGNTGARVSRICLGCMSFGDKRWGPWVLEEEEALPLIKKAYDSGINFFDTANTYSNGVSETILGKAIKKYDLPRGKIVVATKVFLCTVEEDMTFMPMGSKEEIEARGYVNYSGLSRKHIYDSVNASLRRLDLDYIDLLQIHRFDPDTPVEETMGALNDLVRSGKVRYIGASSMWAWQFAKMNAVAEKNGWAKFVTMQNHYNLLHREEEREMIPYCIDSKIGTLPWSPLAGGMLAGKNRGTSREAMYAELTAAESEIVDRVVDLAKKKDVPPAQLALAWVLSKDAISAPIIGPRSEKHLYDGIQALSIQLTEDDIKLLEEPYVPRVPQGHK